VESEKETLPTLGAQQRSGEAIHKIKSVENGGVAYSASEHARGGGEANLYHVKRLQRVKKGRRTEVLKSKGNGEGR